MASVISSLARAALSCRHGWRPSCAAALIVFVAGCGSSGPELIDVTGSVTFNGQPARAELMFEPASSPTKKGGRASTAWTSDDGRFRMGFTRDRFGVVPGKHRVTIRVLRPLAANETPSFQDATNPIKVVLLERTVSDERRHFEFPLSW